jgi:hypothetical protein
MRAVRFVSRCEVGDRDREAPSVRYSRAPAAGHGTSGHDLPLRALPRRDQGGVSRGGGLADPIWRAHQGRGDLSQHPATHPRGSRRASADRSVRRAVDLSGQHRRLGGKEGARARPSLRGHRPARGRGQGQGQGSPSPGRRARGPAIGSPAGFTGCTPRRA